MGSRRAAVAIMQPYFIPYPGYFRLFAATDLFVVYDCVQFPRRGWLHRNQLADAAGQPRWLTLPLVKAARDVLIKDLAFRPDAAAEMHDNCRRFPVLSSPAFDASAFRERFMQMTDASPVEFICSLLQDCCASLGLHFNVLRSSGLGIDSSLRGQDRILAIAREVGASTYVNAPGGRSLYDRRAFEDNGIGLRFLPPWEGSYLSILHQLLTSTPADVAREVKRQSTLEE